MLLGLRQGSMGTADVNSHSGNKKDHYDKFEKLLCSKRKLEKCIDTVSERMYNAITDTVSVQR